MWIFILYLNCTRLDPVSTVFGHLIKIKRAFLVTLLSRVFIGPKELKFSDVRKSVQVFKFTQLFWNSNRKSLKSATNKLLVKLMTLNKKEAL